MVKNYPFDLFVSSLVLPSPYLCRHFPNWDGIIHKNRVFGRSNLHTEIAISSSTSLIYLGWLAEQSSNKVTLNFGGRNVRRTQIQRQPRIHHHKPCKVTLDSQLVFHISEILDQFHHSGTNFLFVKSPKIY